MIYEKIVLNETRNVTLELFLHEFSGEMAYLTYRPVVMVLPGGGYRFCSDREAEPVAMAYYQRGYHTCILRYSVQPHATWPNPLKDYEQAMQLLKAQSDAWMIDTARIAVIGFSAGGHLAASAATISAQKPAAAILGYAVLNENTAVRYAFNAPDTIEAVDEKICPCFLFASRDDAVVPVRNTLVFAQALDRSGVPFELHIYSRGPHGFSVATGEVTAPGQTMCARIPQWVNDSIGWLEEVMGGLAN